MVSFRELTILVRATHGVDKNGVFEEEKEFGGTISFKNMVETLDKLSTASKKAQRIFEFEASAELPTRVLSLWEFLQRKNSLDEITSRDEKTLSQ